MPDLLVRRANASRVSSVWPHEDYDVFDCAGDIGRTYLVDRFADAEIWFWGVSFQVTGGQSNGRADSLEEAKAAFRVEYSARES